MGFDDSAFDNVHYMFFACGRWVWERRCLEMEIGPITPDKVIGVMLRSRKGWAKVATFVRRTVIQLKKPALDRLTSKEEQQDVRA